MVDFRTWYRIHGDRNGWLEGIVCEACYCDSVARARKGLPTMQGVYLTRGGRELANLLITGMIFQLIDPIY